MILPAIRLRLRVVVLVKAYVVRRQRDGFGRVILAIDKYSPGVVTEKLQVGFRNVVMSFLNHGDRIIPRSMAAKSPGFPLKRKEQAPFQKPAPLDQNALKVLELQQPPGRKNLPR